MKVNTLDEGAIRDIGHAFGYYDYGAERGLIDLFPGRDAVASYICGYVRMALVRTEEEMAQALEGIRTSGILQR